MMPPTMRNTQLTGWLRKTPMRDRLQAAVRGGSAAERAFVGRHGVDHAYRRKICWYSFFFSANFFGVESSISTNRILSAPGSGGRTALAIDKLAQLGHHVHALVAEKKVDEGFAGIDMGRFAGRA